MDVKLLADCPEYIPVIARWYYDEWGHEDPKNSYEQTIKRLEGKLNQDQLPLHLIAIEDEEILGVVQLKLYEMSIFPDKEHWLGSVYTAQSARGKGVASSLCNAAINKAKSLNILRLYLQTEKTSDGGLYGQLGWQAIERVHYNGVDVLVMEREI